MIHKEAFKKMSLSPALEQLRYCSHCSLDIHSGQLKATKRALQTACAFVTAIFILQTPATSAER